MQHLANSDPCLSDGLDKTESVFVWKKPLCTGVFCDHRATQRQKSRGAIADPAGSPRHIDALNRGELSKRASQVAAVSRKRGRHTVRIGDLPAEPAQSLSFRVLRSDV